MKSNPYLATNRLSKKAHPFFSIGVTTYDRPDLLRQTLSSIIFQTFPDFEVIVGNDNPQQILSSDLLAITDDRILLVNRPVNLGEIANMSDLLEKSRGRYFTWLADDDLYSPVFLETVYKALIRYKYPPVVFTSYTAGTRFDVERAKFLFPMKYRLFTGSEFLKAYLSKVIMAIGCYGVFSKEYLQRIGGMEKLGQGFSPYSDNWLVIKNGLIEHVGYVDSPLVFFRTHENSISYNSSDVDAYLSAQIDLISKSCELFLSERLRNNFHDNMFFLLAWCIQDFGHVIRRSQSISLKKIQEYMTVIKDYMDRLKGSKYYRKILFTVLRLSVAVALDMGRKKYHFKTN